MTLPPLIRRLLDAKLASWCHARVPDHIRDQLRYEHGIRGNAATLLEVRPFWDGRPRETRHPFAQIRYEDEMFVLYCADRNGRWHEFTPFAPTPDLDAVLGEITEDRTCIFFVSDTEAGFFPRRWRSTEREHLLTSSAGPAHEW